MPPKKSKRPKGFGYTTVAFFGTLMGLNLSVILFRLDQIISPIGLNLMGEGLAMMLIGGLLYDLILRGRKTNILSIPIIAFTGGAVWEVLSFCVGFVPEKAEPILLEWGIYGSISIIILGLPILILTQFIRKEKKIFGINTVNSTGLGFMFISSMILTVGVMWILIECTQIFQWAYGVVG